MHDHYCYDPDQILSLVKARLNILPQMTQLDEYLSQRIEAAAEALLQNGIALEDTPADRLLLVDYTCWTYANRDQSGAMPEWLRLRRRERWLAQSHDS